MKRWTLRAAMAALLVPAAARLWAAPSLKDRVRAAAQKAGLSVPAVPEAAPVRVPVIPAPAVPAPWYSRRVEGSGYVRGYGQVQCMGSVLHGTIRLDGDIDVRGDDGVRGRIDVSGHESVTGVCFNNQGNASLSAEVDGSGPIYDGENRYVGTARVSGRISFVMVRTGSVFLHERVDVSGWY